MGESLLLITIITLIIITIRRAKPVVLENPVVIQRPGQYHITLAPQLNRAQTFVEQIAKQFAQSQSQSETGDIASKYYEVRDPKVFARGMDCYLLAVTFRDGLLYFQATSPAASSHDASRHLEGIREFSESVLKQHPPSPKTDVSGGDGLEAAVKVAAEQLQITVKTLP